MPDHITAHPLTWPVGKPRTNRSDRKFGRFGTKGERWGRDEITVHRAIRRIFDQVRAYTRMGQDWRIDPDDVIVSTNLKARKSDGLPYSDQKEPDDPGVAVYFRLDGTACCVAVDTYRRVADNLAAVAAVLDALRALERHGSGLMEAAFRGFTALPAPGAIVVPDWRQVFEYDGNDLAEAKRRYRALAAKHHPDKGGDATMFDTVRRCWEMAQQELGDA